ncbi:flagellar filament capping protein FliD [Pseudobutyrivibrio sp.]
MPIRLSGLASGLDTEAIVGALVSAYSYKKDKYVKAQTKLSWKQDAWKTLNSKVYGFYTNVGSMRLSSNYEVKKTTVSDTTKAKATASGNAINGTQTLEVKRLAKTAYITGAKLDGSVRGETALVSLGINNRNVMEKASISVRTGTKATTIELDSAMTVNQFVNKLADAGVNANFDEKNQRFYISSKTSGEAGDFSISANSSQGLNALMKLGLLSDREVDAISNTTGGNMAKKLFSTGETGYDYLLDESEMQSLLTDLKNYKNGTATFDDAKKAQLDDLEAYLNTKYANSEYTVTTKDDAGKDVVNTYKYGTDGTIDFSTISDDALNALASQAYKDATYDTTGTKSTVISRTLTFTTGEGSEAKSYSFVKNVDGFKDLIKSIQEGSTDEDIVALKEYLNKTYAGEVYKTTSTNDGITVEKYGTDGTIDWDALVNDEDKLTAFANRLYADSTYDMSSDATYQEISKAVNAVRDGYLAIASAKALPQETSDEIAIRAQAIADAEAKLKEALDDPTNKKWADYIEQNFGAQNSEYDKSYSDFWIQSDNIDLANSVFYRVDLAANVAAGNIAIENSDRAIKIDGQDALISLNGVEYSNGTNSITVNGLTIEALAETTDAITVNVSSDTDALYDKVKDFLTTYNSLMNEMQKLYNADSAKDYEPLTDDEKAEMSESEIEKWEQKIKDSLLRRDGTLSSIISAMTMSMMGTVEINGKQYSWSTFGVHTLGSLNAEKNEGYAYHIDGDSEDSYTSGGKEKLRAALAEEPEVVIEFLKKITSNLYTALDGKMKSSAIKSVYTVYNDKEMASEYSDYSRTIKTWTDRVTDMEDAYYKKFAAMEKALATLQGNSSSISSLLGG